MFGVHVFNNVVRVHLIVLSQCDTFSRSTDAVFELSTRFAEPFQHKKHLSGPEKLEAERLMFLELTQSTSCQLTPRDA